MNSKRIAVLLSQLALINESAPLNRFLQALCILDFIECHLRMATLYGQDPRSDFNFC